VDDRAPDQSELAWYLQGRDVACPGCGYNLRGLSSGTCPECNQALTLTVTLADGHVGQLIAAMVGLSVGAGAAACVLAVVVIFVTLNEKSWPRGHEALVLLQIPGPALACLGIPALLLSRRRGRAWFRALPDHRRLVTIASAWFGLATFFAAFILAALRM
jgi:hypothetical protein